MPEHDDTPVQRPQDAQPHPLPPGPVVVGIGASAGGLDALKRLLATVPANSGLAFVVVTHLSAEHESFLADLLQPASVCPVTQVMGVTQVEPNHVYVIPPGRNLSAVDSHLRLSDLPKSRSQRAPVDHFFRTLSETHDGTSIGVILTGTGSDGTQGIRYIRERGGMVLVQDPEEAEFDGMPRSAIATGLVDRVLPIAEMMEQIVEFARTKPKLPALDEDAAAAAAETPSDPMQTVLTLVRLRTGHDFLRYKRATVGRRVARRMQMLRLEHISEYEEVLRQDEAEAAALLDDLLINVTGFFRDEEVFRTVEAETIPALFEGKGRGDTVRVWCVGCATGEEAYTLGMLLLEEAGRRSNPPRVQVFATDLREPSLQQAREAHYPESIADDVSRERLERFFRHDGGSYRVAKELRDLVVFARHNLLRDPPFSRIDLISCRNLLIYLQREVQEEVMEVFHYALRTDGYLLVGTAETLERSEVFRVVSKHAHLYRRRELHGDRPKLPALTHSAPPEPPSSEALPRATTSPIGHGELHHRSLERFAPPSLLVTPDHRVAHVSESAGRYLQVPGGEPTTNVFRVLREELRVELHTGLDVVREQRRTWHSRPVALRMDGRTTRVVLRVSPASDTASEGFALVLFDQVDENAASAAIATTPADGGETAEEIESELVSTRGRLQAALEQFEINQEEMRASNEELQSANEELRSTMEELETSREELQSVNEELQTLNQEGRHKVEELSQLSGDLQNLLQATDVATLFLDRNLRILRFTPRVSEIFNVRVTDRGRPLADLTHHLGYDTLIEDARRVLQRLVPSEREVRGEDGASWYVVRVTPYRTMDDHIEGVVVTIMDVTPLKHSEQALAESEERLRVAVEAAELGTWELDLVAGAWTARSARHDRLMGYAGAQAEWGLEIALANVMPEDRGLFRDSFEEAVRTGTLSFEARVRWPDGSIHWISPQGRTYYDTDGRPLRMAGIVADVTKRKRAEAELRESEERHRLIVEEARDYAILTMDPQGIITSWSPGAEAVFGWTAAEVVGSDVSLTFTPEDREENMPERERSAARREGSAVDVRWHQCQDGRRIFIEGTTRSLDDGKGGVRGFLKIGQDVTERRAMAEAHQAREALRRLVAAEEAERQRISRDMHDSTGQLVTGLLLGLRTLKGDVGSEASRMRITALEELANRIARDVHDLAVELRPAMLDTQGLAPSLRAYLSEWSGQHDVLADMHVMGLDGKPLPFEVDTTLYRVVQEALTNVAKHARATRVSVVLERKADHVRLVLEDDGIGFDVDETLAAPGKARRLGLRGMRERVALLGGEMEIESSPGRGTSVFVRLPAPDGASGEGAAEP